MPNTPDVHAVDQTGRGDAEASLECRTRSASGCLSAATSASYGIVLGVKGTILSKSESYGRGQLAGHRVQRSIPLIAV